MTAPYAEAARPVDRDACGEGSGWPNSSGRSAGPRRYLAGRNPWIDFRVADRPALPRFTRRIRLPVPVERRSRAPMASWTGCRLGVTRVAAAAFSILSRCSERMRMRLTIVPSAVSAIELSDFFGCPVSIGHPARQIPPAILAVFTETLSRFRSAPGRAGPARGGLLAWTGRFALARTATMQAIAYTRTEHGSCLSLRRHLQPIDNEPQPACFAVVAICDDFSRHAGATLGYERSYSSGAHRTRSQLWHPCIFDALGVHVPRLRRRAEPAVEETAMGMKSRCISTVKPERRLSEGRGILPTVRSGRAGDG